MQSEELVRILFAQRCAVLVAMCYGLAVAGAVLVWRHWSVHQAVVDLQRSSATVNTVALTNDGQVAWVTVALVDSSGHPIADMPVHVVPSVPILVAVRGRTDAQGLARLETRIVPGDRHHPTAVGAVSLRILVGGGIALHTVPRVLVYNRVAVLVQGLGTALACPTPSCVPASFTPLTNAVLRPLGYLAARSPGSVMQFSYRGGQMVQRPTTWEWQPAAYGTCDTAQTVATSAQLLRHMLRAYRQRYPYTTFELLGHSLGGLVALEGSADPTFLAQLGARAIDKIVTIDSPVNGITGFDGRAWLVDAMAGIEQLGGCLTQGMGLPLLAELSGLGDAAPGRQDAWASLLRSHGIELLTVTNAQDTPVPPQYALIDFGKAAAAADRLDYSVAPLRTMGHSDLLYPQLARSTPNPIWADFTRRLRNFLQQPCLTFAARAAACRYPNINRTG